ncbi:hypothetical protein AYI70_g5504 [Smittium culicis]|uniref:Uncharacterized protein n=1 Tax=Smittium culicis TaxID=133412 RepID=A0A1R1XUH2_9FUNG|nr:hypothetical protein AYI70_g5504 [Smittium culicis]
MNPNSIEDPVSSAQKLLFDALYESYDPKVCLKEASNFAQQISRTALLSDNLSKTKISPIYHQNPVTDKVDINRPLNEAGANSANTPAPSDNHTIANINNPENYFHFHTLQSAVATSNQLLIDGLNDAKRKIQSLKIGQPASKINQFTNLAESIISSEKNSIYSSKKKELEHNLKLLESQHKQFMLNFFAEFNKTS